MSAIFIDAVPSPYGLLAFAILLYSSTLVNNSLNSLYIFSSYVPTSFKVPAFTPSGLSVVSRITKTGFPNDGASS